MEKEKIVQTVDNIKKILHLLSHKTTGKLNKKKFYCKKLKHHGILRQL